MQESVHFYDKFTLLSNIVPIGIWLNDDICDRMY